MSRQIQIRRGTAAQHSNFTGAIGEITMDTTNKTLRVHDGSKAGGYEMMSVDKFQKNISNCILETPQDINLTLSNGTITLKKGSKVYIPNGAGVFDTYTTTSDKTFTATGNGTYILDINDNNNLDFQNVNYVSSGDSLPANYSGLFYDTTNNIIAWYNNGTAVRQDYSFPICVFTVSNGAISSIDRIFNGFGYIGSALFVLPGIKALAPNGRNADGTMKNTICSTDRVRTVKNFTSTNGYTVGIAPDGAIVSFFQRIRIQETYPGGGYMAWYKPSENKLYNTNDSGAGSEIQKTAAVLFYFNSATKTFDVKNTFDAIDYADTDYITHQSMPSGKYIVLTLGASDTTYTAPADGYFTLAKQAGNSGEYIFMINDKNNMNIGAMSPSALNGRLFIPVSAGDVIKVIYTFSGTTHFFRFVYANGAA